MGFKVVNSFKLCSDMKSSILCVYYLSFTFYVSLKIFVVNNYCYWFIKGTVMYVYSSVLLYWVHSAIELSSYYIRTVKKGRGKYVFYLCYVFKVYSRGKGHLVAYFKVFFIKNDVY